MSVGIVIRGSPYLSVMFLFGFWYFYLYHIPVRCAVVIDHQNRFLLFDGDIFDEIAATFKRTRFL